LKGFSYRFGFSFSIQAMAEMLTSWLSMGKQEHDGFRLFGRWVHFKQHLTEQLLIARTEKFGAR
jgi:hypothetical protein